MSKKMIIKGVGRFMARKVVNGIVTNEVLDCGTLQNLKIDLNVELEDIFGGDGMFAIDQLLKNKAIHVTATDAKFDLNMLPLMMGGSVKENETTTLWVLGEQKTAMAFNHTGGAAEDAAKITLDTSAANFAHTGLTVKVKDENRVLEAVVYDAGAVPHTGQYMLDASGQDVTIVLPPAYAGADMVLNYQKRAADVAVYDIMAKDIPFPVSIVHQGTFVQKDGTEQGIQTELYACMASGTFTMDMQQNAASSHEVALKVIDPERADGKLGDMKRFAV